jgi:uncharacterized membrane protein
MKWSVSSSTEQTFRSLVLYFNARRVKTIARRRPSYVKAEIGSWFSFTDEWNAKGEVEATIMGKNEGSRVSLRFSFAEEYWLGFLAAGLGAFSFCLAGLVLNSLVIGLLGAMIFVMVMALESRAVSHTRRRFTEEFNLLMKLLSTQL